MFKTVNTPGGGGEPGNYLKIHPGESINGVFRGDVYVFYQKWTFGSPISERVQSDKPFEGGTMRFKANFVVYENKKFVAKIFEFASGMNNDLAKLAKVCDVRKTKVMISRDGEGKNTRYTVLPVLNEPLTPAALAQIENVKLNILNGSAPKPKAPEPMPEPDFSDAEFESINEDDLPF